MVKTIALWFAGILLVGGACLFAASLYLDPERFLGPFRMSFGIAIALNLSVGLAGGYVGGILKWFGERDASEQAMLFGLKAGLMIFLTLMLISLVLKLIKQPPTYAPYAVVVAPYLAFEFGICCCDPLFWAWIAWDESRGWRAEHDKRKREKWEQRLRGKDPNE